MKNHHNSGLGTQSFDWQEIRQRIAIAEAALAEMDQTTPEVMERVWARRAAQLAQAPPQEDKGGQMVLELIRLGREIYGLEAQYVFDNWPLEQITPVPRVPDWVAGVVNLRGRILSVIDLRRYFGLPAVEESEDNEPAEDFRSVAEVPYLVVVETPDMEVALLVDDVLTVKALPTHRMQAPTSAIRGIPAEYVQGVIERSNGYDAQTVVVLDLPTLLADGRLIVHEELV
jgi:purine-binding chemotaxis protein CheW